MNSLMSMRAQASPEGHPAEMWPRSCARREGYVHRLWAPLHPNTGRQAEYVAKFSAPSTSAVHTSPAARGSRRLRKTPSEDERILALASKVRSSSIRTTPIQGVHGHVRMTWKDGECEGGGAPAAYPRGAQEPLSRAEIEAKFHGNRELAAGRGACAAIFGCRAEVFPRTA